jgi:signal transduction histidine kinase
MVVDELELRRAKAEAEKRKLQAAYAASEEARTRSTELQEMLAGATGLIGSSTDHPAALREIAERVVPALADVCIVDVATDEGRLQRVAVAAADPARQHLVRAARLVPPSQAPGTALAAVLTLGKPLLVPSFSGQASGDSALRHEPFVHACGARSALYVPIVAHGRALGAFTFLAVGANRAFAGADLAAAEQLARHAALALENDRLFDEARRAEQARAQLLECVGHDLARPITGLLASVEALVQALPGGRRPGGRQQVEDVQHGIQRTRRLLQDLVDVARIDSGQLTVDGANTDLQTLIEEAVQPLRPTAHGKEIQLLVQVLPEARGVCCDRARIIQVFHNLVDNALKFTPCAGRVRLAAERNGPTVMVTVEDSGPGLTSQQVAHLFERSAPGSGPLAGRPGLGLFIARAIVDAHGCAIWVDLAVKTGTRFCFTLPTAVH